MYVRVCVGRGQCTYAVLKYLHTHNVLYVVFVLVGTAVCAFLYAFDSIFYDHTCLFSMHLPACVLQTYINH